MKRPSIRSSLLRPRSACSAATTSASISSAGTPAPRGLKSRMRCSGVAGRTSTGRTDTRGTVGVSLAVAGLLGVVIVSLAGCAGVIRVARYEVLPRPNPAHLLGGVGRVDITPAAGYPMGGHSFAGRVSRGHWLRLYARAFYLRDRSGNSIAM